MQFCVLQFHAFKAHTWYVLDLINTCLAWWVSQSDPTLLWSITANVQSEPRAAACIDNGVKLCVHNFKVYCWILTMKRAFVQSIDVLWRIINNSAIGLSSIEENADTRAPCRCRFPECIAKRRSHHSACWLSLVFFLIIDDSLHHFVPPSWRLLLLLLSSSI